MSNVDPHTSKGERQYESFPIRVDYGKSIEEATQEGDYTVVSPIATSENFPATRKGVGEFELAIIHFDKHLLTSEVLRELEAQGYRPADLQELLAFGTQHPELQRKLCIVALGSVFLDEENGVRYALELDGSAGMRRVEPIEIYFPGEEQGRFLGEETRFAAVRKDSK